MEKIKITTHRSYTASGYGRGLRNNVTIYLINGKAYARDKERASSSFEPLEGELANYVRVNEMKGFGGFYQVSRESEHELYKPIKSTNMKKKFKIFHIEKQEGLSNHSFNESPFVLFTAFDEQFDTIEEAEKYLANPENGIKSHYDTYTILPIYTF